MTYTSNFYNIPWDTEAVFSEEHSKTVTQYSYPLMDMWKRKRCRYHTQARTQVLCLKKECIILRRPCFVLATLVVNQAVIGGGVSSGDCDLAASFRRRVRGELGECGRVGRFGERVGDDDADECLLVGEWLARGRYPCPTCACTVRTCRPCDRATSCSR